MTKLSTLANELYPYLLPKLQKSGRNGNGGSGSGVGSGATLLSQLGDVQLTSLADGEFLAYESSIAKWVNVPAPAGAGGGSYTAGWGIDIDTSTIAVDVLEITDLNSGLELTGVAGSQKVAVNLQSSSGLVANSSGLALDSNLAGDGLEMTAGKIMSVVPAPAGGLDVDATGVFVVPHPSGGLDTDSAGLYIVKPLVSGLVVDGTGLYIGDIGGNGLLWDSTAKTLAVRTGNGLEIVSDLVRVDESDSFTWTGTHQFNAPPQINANLNFIGTARSITSQATLTVMPTGNLHLDPSGNITMPNAQVYRSTTINDLPTGIDGLNVFNRSDFSPDYVQLTIGAIKSDELHVRVFVADETRINRGEEYWSKSFGIVQTDFSIPAIGANVDVWFEDAPGMAGANLFAANDWLLMRSINWGTGLVVQKVWFQVVGSKLAQETTAINGVDRQQWRLVRRAGGWTTTGAANRVKAGNVMLDAGQVGQGWVHLSALASDGGPFIQFGKMTSVSTTPLHSNYVRIGNLKNTVGYSADAWGIAAGNNLGLDPALGAFRGFVLEGEQGLSLYNSDLVLYSGATKVVTVNRGLGLTLRNDTASLANEDRNILWYDDIDVRTSVPRAGISSAVFSSSGRLHRQIEIFSSAVLDTADAVVAMRALEPANERSAFLELHTQETLSSGTIGSRAYLFANEIWLDSKVLIGSGATAEMAKLHVRENSTITDQRGGLLIEQITTGSVGDAALRWRLTTANRYYTMGIDNSDGDKFKISASAVLGTSDFFVYDPATGLVTVSGLTGGSGGGGGTYTAGDGIIITGSEISVDFSLVASGSTVIQALGGLTGGGSLGDPTIPLAVGEGAGIQVGSDLVSIRLATASGLNTTSGLSVDTSLAGNGLQLNLTTKQLHVMPLSTGGLETGADEIHIKLRSISGLDTDTSGLYVLRLGGTALLSGLAMTAADGLSVSSTLAGDGLVWDATNATMHVNAGIGLEMAGDTVRIMVPANSGLSRDSTGIYVNPSIAGDGLLYAGGIIDIVPLAAGGLEVGANEIHIKIPTTAGLTTSTSGLFVLLPSASGLVRDSTGLSILLPATSGLLTSTSGLFINLPANSQLVRDSTGLYVASSLAGLGLQMNASRQIDVQSADGSLSVAANDVEVNTAHSFAWTADHTFSSGTVQFNTAPQINANLNFIGTARTVTAANTLTLRPTGNLVLNPTVDLMLDPSGLILMPDAQELRTASFTDAPTGIIGMRMWEVTAGTGVRGLTIGTMRIDNLYARVFTSDEVRVRRGEMLLGKSYGIVETAFTMPAIDATNSVWFENAPAAGSANLFDIGDYLQLRTIDWSTGLVITMAWFEVVSLVTAGSVDNYRQRWSIRHRFGGTPGSVVPASVTMLDVGDIGPGGTPGDGVIHLVAYKNSGGPMMQVGDITSIAGTDDFPLFTYRARFGNLNGAAGISSDLYGIAAGNNLALTPTTGYSGFTNEGTNGLQLYNTDLTLYGGPTKLLVLDRTDGLAFRYGAGSGAPTARIDWVSDLDDIEGRIAAGYYANIQVHDTGSLTRMDIGASNVTGTGSVRLGTASAGFSLGLTIESDYIQFTDNQGTYWRSKGNRHQFGGTSALAIASTMHVYENTTATGATAGLTVEQDGTGDASMQFYLTGGQYWALGIDNDDGDKFKIAAAADLANGIFTLTTAGNAGIGTDSPTAKLSVADASGGGTGTYNFSASVSSSYALNMALDDSGLKLGPSSSSRDIQFQTAGTTRLSITPTGNIGVNTTGGAAAALLHMVKEGANADALFISYGAGFTALLQLYSANGTQVSPTATQTGDVLGQLVFQGFDTARSSGASIRGVAAGEWGTAGDPTDDPTNIIFATVPDGSGTLLDRMIITSQGHVGIGTLTPGVDIVGTYDSTSTPIVQVDGATPRLTARGSTDAALNLIDTGSAANAKWIQLLNSAGITKFVSMSDAGAAAIDNILVLDHLTGALGVGVAAPAAMLDIVQTPSEGVRVSAFAQAPVLLGRRAQGSGTSQVVSGNDLLVLGAQGYTSSGWPAAGSYSGSIRFTAAENHTSTARGTDFNLYVTPATTATPNIGLTVQGDRSFLAPGIYDYVVATVPNVTVVAGGNTRRTTHANSSLRYKRDISRLGDDQFSELFAKLNPVSFFYRKEHGDDGKRRIGLIAEEVEAAGGTDFVQVDEQGRPDVVLYDRLIVVLIAEMRKLQRRMLELEGSQRLWQTND